MSIHWSFTLSICLLLLPQSSLGGQGSAFSQHPLQELRRTHQKCTARLGIAGRRSKEIAGKLVDVETRWELLMQEGSIRTQRLALNPFQKRVIQAYFKKRRHNEFEKLALIHMTDWFYQYYRQGSDVSLHSFHRSAFAERALKYADESQIKEMYTFIAAYAVRLEMIEQN